MLSPASNDLYTLVAVEFQAIIDAQYRVTSIKHTISTDKWTVDYGFSVDGQVASPSMTPSPAGITAVDGVWQTLMLTSPWTNSTQTAEIMRKNGVVYLRGAITRNAAASGSIVATLPAGYRPGGEWRFMNDTNLSSTSSMRCTIQSDGVTRIYDKTGSFTSAYIHTSFPAEA